MMNMLHAFADEVPRKIAGHLPSLVVRVFLLFYVIRYLVHPMKAGERVQTGDVWSVIFGFVFAVWAILYGLYVIR